MEASINDTDSEFVKYIKWLVINNTITNKQWGEIMNLHNKDNSTESSRSYYEWINDGKKSNNSCVAEWIIEDLMNLVVKVREIKDN